MLGRIRERLRIRRRWAAVQDAIRRVERQIAQHGVARLDGVFARVGVTRGALVRRLVRLGHPRLRSLDERVRSNRLIWLLLWPARAWLNAGSIQIPSGLAHGMWLAKRDLPLSHAHLGSLAHGNLEASVQEAMLRHVALGSVFFDIGANLGFFTLLAARLVGGQGRVFAFEPAPDNAAAIRRNLDINSLSNVAVMEMAVAGESGPGQLQVVDDQSWSKLIDYGAHPGTQQVLTVELVKIDDLVASGKLPPPDAVKIDIEGAEIVALEGMRETIERHRPAIICELHDTHSEFVALMDGYGYRTINLEGPGAVTDAGASAHALALPVDHPGD